MAEISQPPIAGICRRKKLRYGSVTVNTGLRIGNCCGSCGNQDRAILNTMTLLNKENALAIPPKMTAFPTALPGITAAGTPVLLLSNLPFRIFSFFSPCRLLIMLLLLLLRDGEMKAAGESDMRTACNCVCKHKMSRRTRDIMWFISLTRQGRLRRRCQQVLC